jgi:hypothetical protein
LERLTHLAAQMERKMSATSCGPYTAMVFDKPAGKLQLKLNRALSVGCPPSKQQLLLLRHIQTRANSLKFQYFCDMFCPYHNLDLKTFCFILWSINIKEVLTPFEEALDNFTLK